MGIGSIFGSVANAVKNVISPEPAQPAAPPPPPPRPSTPPSYETGFDKGPPATIQDARGAGGDPNALPEVIAARSKASKNGDVVFDVGPGSDSSILSLLRATPQVDANNATTEDGHRCAAASTFNAMLIDGRPQDNAEAIEKYAKKIGYELKPEEREAVAAFKTGKLTPRQAGVLQESVFNMAKANDAKREARSGNKGPDRVTADGMTTPGAAEVLAGLRANGAMTTLREVQLQMKASKASDGTPFGHATLTAQKSDGSWVSTDTWPNKQGEATVSTSPVLMDMVRKDKAGNPQAVPGALGMVTLSNLGAATRVSFAYPATGPNGQPQLVRGTTSNFDPRDFKSGTLQGFDMYMHDLQSGTKIRVDSTTGTALLNSPYVE